MNHAFWHAAHFPVPPSFSAAVSSASRKAVASPPCRGLSPRKRLILLLALLLILSSTAIAAITDWRAKDFFTRQQGFMLPAYEWGSSASLLRDDTITLYEQTGHIDYQYHQDRLISVTISFHRQNQPNGQLRTYLYRQIYNDLCTLYGSPQTSALSTEQKQSLQNALQKYLETDQPGEAEKMAQALSMAGAEEELTARAQSAVTVATTLVQRAWTDAATRTAISLHAEYLPGSQEIRLLTLTLSYFP